MSAGSLFVQLFFKLFKIIKASYVPLCIPGVNYGLQEKPSMPPNFTNEILLEDSHASSFTVICGCFRPAVA